MKSIVLPVLLPALALVTVTNAAPYANPQEWPCHWNTKFCAEPVKPAIVKPEGCAPPDVGCSDAPFLPTEPIVIPSAKKQDGCAPPDVGCSDAPFLPAEPIVMPSAKKLDGCAPPDAGCWEAP